MCCGTSDIGMTCLPLSMMNTCMDEKSIYFSIICCRSWLAVNVLWHKWHWNDLSFTLHDDHLCAWKTQIFFKCLLQKLTCSKWVLAQVILECILQDATLQICWYDVMKWPWPQGRTGTGTGSGNPDQIVPEPDRTAKKPEFFNTTLTYWPLLTFCLDLSSSFSWVLLSKLPSHAI